MESKNYIKSVIKDIQNMSLQELRIEGVLIYNLFPTDEVKQAIKKLITGYVFDL